MLDATKTPELLEEARALFGEYQRSAAGNRDFEGYLDLQGFDAEIASLPGPYAPPRGRLLVAHVDGSSGPVAAGCVALQPLDDVRCEMKRMYVRPEHRGASIGRELAAAVVAEARAAGYHRMLLDTLPHMREAIALYRSLGFRDSARYRYNPVEESLFFELVL